MRYDKHMGRTRIHATNAERQAAYRRRQKRTRRNTSGNPEWYTPLWLLDVARTVAGGFDFDPAGCAESNIHVRAAQYLDRDGERLPWPAGARVWCNPPYSRQMVAVFAGRCREHDGPALLLTNACTDTVWWQEAVHSADALCLLAGRVRFLTASGKPAQSPTMGQSVIGWRMDADRFRAAFASRGLIY